MSLDDNDIGPSQIVTSTTRRKDRVKSAPREPFVGPLPKRTCCSGNTAPPESPFAPEPYYEHEPYVQKPLTWPTIIKLFVLSVKSWKQAGYKLVDKAEHKRRYSICKGCDFLVNYQCQKCGCFMFVKSKLSGMECKESLW
jgi:hypothetical protein